MKEHQGHIEEKIVHFEMKSKFREKRRKLSFQVKQKWPLTYRGGYVPERHYINVIMYKLLFKAL